MATRADVHRLVERLDEERLPDALTYLLRMTNGEERLGSDGLEDDDVPDEIADDLGEPITAEDSLWRIVGIGTSAEPTDVRNRKDEYLAEAFDPRSRQT